VSVDTVHSVTFSSAGFPISCRCLTHRPLCCLRPLIRATPPSITARQITPLYVDSSENCLVGSPTFVPQVASPIYQNRSTVSEDDHLPGCSRFSTALGGSPPLIVFAKSRSPPTQHRALPNERSFPVSSFRKVFSFVEFFLARS